LDHLHGWDIELQNDDEIIVQMVQTSFRNISESITHAKL